MALEATVIFFGVSLLATEFFWARRLLLRVRRETSRLKELSKRTLGLGDGYPPAE